MQDNKDIIEKILPDDLFGKNLYHYTSFDGLMGILDFGKIRCTQIFYLNDIEENLNGWKYFIDVLETNYKSTEYAGFRTEIKRHLQHWFNIDFENLTNADFKKLNISDYKSFVFSLSMVNDDLNQWRSYAGNNIGFSIEFNFNQSFIEKQSELIDTRHSEAKNNCNCRILFRKCIYEDEFKRGAFQTLLDFYYKDFLEDVKYTLDNLFFDILTLCLFFKNPKFEAEQECRIVVLPLEDYLVNDSKVNNLIKFRAGKNLIVPYIEIDCIQDNVLGVTVGPSPHPYHSLEALKIMNENLKRQKKTINDLNLYVSKVPYRSW